VKRIHEYKRQLLNLLSVAARWQSLLDAPNDSLTMTPRTVIIAGKAASAYKAAKQIIRLANDMARVINADARTQDQLKLVFIPDYGVNVAERVMPAADLSQQISTAGTEASGTGNMKFALNGALTIGTWDGANIEMAQSMGAENMFVFGLHTHEVAAVHEAGTPAQSFIDQNAALARVLDAIEQGVFSPEEPGRYRDLVHTLRHHDRYLLCADFGSYVQAQARVDALYAQPQAWHAMAARNIAGMGPFSADRAVLDYVQQVWALPR
jgi:glycogen phosphorylase